MCCATRVVVVIFGFLREISVLKVLVDWLSEHNSFFNHQMSEECSRKQNFVSRNTLLDQILYLRIERLMLLKYQRSEFSIN